MKIKCLTPRAKALGVKQLIFILDFGSKSNIDLMDPRLNPTINSAQFPLGTAKNNMCGNPVASLFLSITYAISFERAYARVKCAVNRSELAALGLVSLIF